VPVAAPAVAAPTPAPSGSPGPAAVLQLPAGTSLAPGRYPVVVRDGGRQIAVTASVGPLPVVATPPAAAPAGSGSAGPLLAVLVTALVAAVLAGLYLTLRPPMRRRREYGDLVARLDAGDHAGAVTGLTRLEAQLPPELRSRARFFIGYGLYQVGDLDEAEHRLAALHREEPDHAEVAYLLAYLRVQRRDFDGAEPVLAALDKRQRLDVGEARRLYGVVQFQRATRAVADGRIDAAATLFEHVERLGDFRDRVPADLRNRHAVVGARALLDHDLTVARKQFDELAAVPGTDELRSTAKLGQALTDWLENQPGSGERVYRLVTDCIQLLHPKAALNRAWPGPPSEDVADQLDAVAESAALTPAVRDRRRTLRDLYFLRGLAFMRAWTERDGDPDKAPAFVAACAQRFAGAVALDRQFADPYLVVGLLRYHLAATAADRGRAVGELRAAHTLGVRDPELLQLLHRYEAQAQSRRNAYTTYLDLLSRRGAQATIGDTLRDDAARHATRYGRVPNRDGAEDAATAGTAPPSVAELRDRAELLAARLQSFDGAMGADDFAAASALARKLLADNAALTDHVRAVEEGEAALLALIGGRLIEEEETTA
jgi:hypothetical protein